MYDESLDARNNATRAISIGCAARASGTIWRQRDWNSSSSIPSGWIIGVSTGPGWIELTRMPSGARSSAAALVMPRTAHFDATYAMAPV